MADRFVAKQWVDGSHARRAIQEPSFRGGEGGPSRLPNAGPADAGSDSGKSIFAWSNRRLDSSGKRWSNSNVLVVWCCVCG